jgi:hypothetical protein
MSKSGIKKEALTKIKRTSILIIFIIISFFLGRYSYYLESNSLPADLMLQPGKTYQQGVNEVKNVVEKRLEEAGIIPQSVVHINNATIKSINGQNLVVEFDAATIDFLQEGKVIKTVVASDGTTVEQRIPKSQEEIDKLISDFQKKSQEVQKNTKNGQEAEIVQPPLPYIVKNLKLSDLKVGNIISIESKTDVRKTDTIEAVSIQLLSQ